VVSMLASFISRLPTFDHSFIPACLMHRFHVTTF
jgi:hypothetical protein